jgi:hypothetical protein
MLWCFIISVQCDSTWDFIVVTTGGGSDFDEIEPLLVATIADLDGTLPADPAVTSEFDTALNNITDQKSSSNMLTQNIHF